MDIEKISTFRNKFEENLADSISEVDDRDVRRIKSDDRYVQCFLNWRKGDVDAAVKMSIDVLKWRKQKNISGICIEEMDEELLRRGVIFVHGKALDDTRLIYFLGRHQTKDVKENIQKILCLWLERLHHQETGRHITFMLDVSKTTMSNVDLGGIRFLLECFTLYFPDMLAIWKVVKQWMTEEQRKRTAFINFKDLKQFVSPDNTLKYMGGEDEWTYEYPLPLDTIPQLALRPNYDSPSNEAGAVSANPDNDDHDVEEEEYFVDDVIRVENVNGLTEASSLPSLNGSWLSVQSDVSSNTLSVPGTTSALKKDADVPPPTNRVPTPGINLNSLLIMSPASEIAFDEEGKDAKTGRYQSYVKLTNCKDTGQVAFKIKTNSPDRYHVKPNSGCLAAGEIANIRINLSQGFEEDLEKDRFLILYQVKDDDSDLLEFWKKHLPKDMRHEHRIRVKFTSSSPAQTGDGTLQRKARKNIPELKETSATDVEIEKIRKDIFGLKNELMLVQNNTMGLRSRLQYTLALNCLVLLFILYLVHQLSLITMHFQYDDTSEAS